MKLEDIFSEWEKDSKFDPSELGKISLNLPKLHHKYYKILSNERLLLKKMEAEFKSLKLEKFEFYQDGPSVEQQQKGWVYPAKGKILKSDIPNYIEADPHIIQFNLKIAYQNEKLDVLESIIKMIMNRGWHVKTAVEWEKFKMGA